MHEQANTYLAHIIKQGIAIDACKGAAHAWVFLAYHAVPRPVIARILANCAYRRAIDLSAQSAAADLMAA